ncbi:MotA/TolQ/ExbB proton channel family protein [Pontiellaceae bacterium B1224]|nr:MotA/TolQ/ExbB proton channel family protein [Pontiellaceae bacterium B1224]
MKTKTKLKTLLTVGIILALGPVWGLLGTFFGMVMAFGHMGESGMGKSELLANDIGVALHTTAVGLIMCPVGIAFIVISCIFLNRIKNGSSAESVATVLIDPP